SHRVRSRMRPRAESGSGRGRIAHRFTAKKRTTFHNGHNCYGGRGTSSRSNLGEQHERLCPTRFIVPCNVIRKELIPERETNAEVGRGWDAQVVLSKQGCVRFVSWVKDSPVYHQPTVRGNCAALVAVKALEVGCVLSVILENETLALSETTTGYGR